MKPLEMLNCHQLLVTVGSFAFLRASQPSNLPLTFRCVRANTYPSVELHAATLSILVANDIIDNQFIRTTGDSSL